MRREFLRGVVVARLPEEGEGVKVVFGCHDGLQAVAAAIAAALFSQGCGVPGWCSRNCRSGSDRPSRRCRRNRRSPGAKR